MSQFHLEPIWRNPPALIECGGSTSAESPALPADPVPDSFTAEAIADLEALLARLDSRGGHGLAAIHLQWAIELLGGAPRPDPREAGNGPWQDDG